MNMNNLCMGCMKDIGVSNQCPYCGYHRGMLQGAPFLQPGIIIDGRYLIGKRIDSNGDGVTYMAWHLDREVPVTVREYLPDAISSRGMGETRLNVMNGCEMVYYDCMQSFIDLWRKLARMRGLSALIPVFDIVETNGTAYAISEYVEGVTLRDYLLRSDSGYLTWEQTRMLFMPVLSTIGALHNAGVIHRGISPATIIVCRDGKLKLSGFSIRQVRCAVGELNAELVEGFAAIEQYGIDLQQGAWTDVYSFGAVLYRTLIGSIPLDATKRVVNDTLMIPARFAERLPAHVIEALINALQVMPEDRTKTIEMMRAELTASTSNPAQSPQYIPQAPLYTDRPPVNARNIVAENYPSQPANDNTANAKNIKEDKKSSGNGLKITIVILLVLVLGSVVALGVYLAMEAGYINPLFDQTSQTEEMTTTAPIKYTVPNYVGKTATSVQADATQKEYFTLVYENRNSIDIEKGLIMEQNVAPNTQVEKGHEIILYVSIGPASVIIPDVKGKDYQTAITELEALGLICEVSYKLNDGSQEAGKVVSTLPGSGEEIFEGEKIYVNVWAEVETQPTTDATTSSPNSIWPWDWF